MFVVVPARSRISSCQNFAALRTRVGDVRTRAGILRRWHGPQCARARGSADEAGLFYPGLPRHLAGRPAPSGLCCWRSVDVEDWWSVTLAATASGMEEGGLRVALRPGFRGPACLDEVLWGPRWWRELRRSWTAGSFLVAALVIGWSMVSRERKMSYCFFFFLPGTKI